MKGFYGKTYDANGNLTYDPDDIWNEDPAVPGAALAVTGPQVLLLADVEPERVRWLWDGYLPLGKVVVLDGDPGVGKSTVMLDLAARVSTGSPMPDGTAPVKGAVLVLSAEDGLADTIRPRLDAAGADPGQIVTITEMVSYGDDGKPAARPVSLPGDLPAVEQVVTANGVVLVVVDVLMAYLSGDVNSHRDQDVRRALHPLAIMAERAGCCVIVLRHLNKSPGPNAMYRGGGSIGIIGAARAGFMCGTDPDDETGTTRVFARVKGNLSEEPPSLAYRLVNDELHGCARVQWEGVSEHRAISLLAEPGDPEERSDRDAAAEWLIAYLTDQDGEARAGDVIKAATRDGIARTTLHRARKRAGIATAKATFGGGWVWQLDPRRFHEGSEESRPQDVEPTEPSVEPSEPTCPHGRRYLDRPRGMTTGSVAYCECCGNPWNAAVRPGTTCRACLPPDDSRHGWGDDPEAVAALYDSER